MGKINPKGQLSGSIGRFVFVNIGDMTVVRGQPSRIKQTAATEKSANCFGNISHLDKLYRKSLLRHVPITTDKTYAYRHRTHFNRMAVRNTDPKITNTAVHWDLPKMMVGFEFNKNAEWQSICHFFPEFILDTTQRLSISIPELSLKRDIRPVAKSDRINLTFYVIAVDMNSLSYPFVQVFAEFTTEISSHMSSPATIWTTEPLPPDQMIFVIGICKMNFTKPDKDNKSHTAASCYLWSK